MSPSSNPSPTSLERQENVSVEATSGREKWFVGRAMRYLRSWALRVGLPVIPLLAIALLSQSEAVQYGATLDEGGHHGNGSFGGMDSDGVGGAGSQGAPLMTGGETAPLLCDREQALDVLFIGNSYTHFYEMPEMLSAMAESAGCKLNVEYVAPGGGTLGEHAVSGVTLSTIGSRDWDAVVLQNYSQIPSQPLTRLKEKSLADVQSLAAAIVENNPSTALYYYVTWGRRDGDRKYCAKNPEVCTFAGHTQAVYRGYAFYQAQTGGTLADVGGAWASIQHDKRSPFPFHELYNPDGTHPSLKGSYLAASVFFTTLFRASPEGLSYPQGLSRSSAEYIQKVAGRLPISGA